MLRATYKIGSQCILPNAHDIDILKIYDTKEEAHDALIYNLDHSVDYHFDYITRIPYIFLGCYIYPYMELISGEEIQGIKDFSIFKHEQEYKQLLRRHVSWMRKDCKWWYHVYIAACMFDNNEMKLTPEQTLIAQEIHDHGITPELEQYINSIIKEG